jgi:hypothetical protein
MDSNFSWFANRTIAAVSSDGRHFRITLRLGVPYKLLSEEWARPVAVEGLQEHLHDVHGTDAWHALQLAQTLQAQLLGYFIQDGGELFLLEPREQLELAEIFPRIPDLETPLE